MIYLLIKNKKLFLVAIIVLLLLSIIFKDIIVQILDRFTKYGHKDFIDKIFTGRVTIWENYFNACTSSFKNFMLGFGATTNHLNNISAHNTYLELLYRNGFIGIILLLSLIISYFVIIVKKYNGNVKYANLISILALLLIAFEESLLPIFGPFIILVLIFTFDIKTNNLQFKEKKMTFKRIKHALINLIVSPFFWGKPKVMDSRQTVEYILKNNVSIGRFGDGELNLMSGCGIKFQKYDKALADKLKSLKTDDKFLVCIPNIFDKEYFNKNVLVDGEYKFWKKYKSNNNFILKKYFNKQIVCGDTEVSRFYIRYKDKSGVAEYIKLFKKLWEKRNVIIVEGATSKVGCENDLLNNALSIRRIIGPSKDAYDYYDEILQTVKQNYKKGDLVLLALGPTATALAYDLSKSGIQALDLGHFDIEYEWFLANATEKIPVKNKHVNECNSMGEENSTDEKYNKEIVYKIKVT